MRKILKTIGLSLVLALAVLASAIVASAQARSLEEGQTVEIFCNCFGDNAWVKGKIESISDSGYVVRYGDGRYQTKTVSFGSDRIRDPNQTVIKKQETWQPHQPTQPSVRDTVKTADKMKHDELAEQLNREPKNFAPAALALSRAYINGRPFENYSQQMSTDPVERKEVMSDLAELDALCKSKYAELKVLDSELKTINVLRTPSIWCEIAARRLELEQADKAAAKTDALEGFKKGYIDNIRSAMQADYGRISDEVQFMVFERERWVASLKGHQYFTPRTGITAPTVEMFKEVFVVADELAAQIEAEAPARSWDAPLLHNAALEGFVRNYYAKYLKGVQILKIGMYQNDYKTFKNNLGIPTSQVISGVALVKAANRPFCQSQIFELKKEYLGGGRFSPVKPNYIAREGTFVKCQ